MVTASGVALAATPLPRRRPPNIIFVLADDLGYGDIGAYGQARFRTPNIDRLAEQGRLFTQGYAGAPVCSPSRGALLTGQHTGHARIRDNFALAAGHLGYKGEQQLRRASLTPQDRTVAQHLKAAGYATGIMGKWHLDGYDPAAVPTNFGFDEFKGWLVTEPVTEGYWPAKRMHNTQMVDVAGNAGGARQVYDTDLITDESIDFIGRHRAAPFFLYVAYNAPHSPHIAPDFGPYADQSWPDDEKFYAAMIDRLDRNVGRLLEQLKATGIDEDTMVIFSSDNGPRSEPSAPQTRVADSFDSNGGLTGYKRDMYEGGLRVPFLVRWPGQIAAGSRSDVPIYFPDLLPTALSAAGAPSQPGDGIDLLPHLLNTDAVPPDRFMYWEFYSPEYRQAARYGKWKAVRLQRAGQTQLFDLSADPWESRNLASDYPEVVQFMNDGMAREHRASAEYPDPTPAAEAAS
ncbi:arylsulfatase [Croceibacterium sp. TMG7-5b_MA50]|uniref:arylsulfatase n=1 Tax=Croceibacterium sp. TMG7-5b_MA50 TaxID=3121290 RepID=UPI003221A4C9